MSDQMIIDALYRELLFTSLILLSILLYNNLVLYGRKLGDYLSLMLVSATIMCAFEIFWDYCDGHAGLRVLSYIGACVYAVSFVAFLATLNHFFIEQFGLTPKKKWLRKLMYNVPNTLFFLLCVTTPWTQLVFWVDENGVTKEMVLFDMLFTPLLVFYLVTALLPAVYYAFLGGKKNREACQSARYLLIFGVMVPCVYIVQMLVLGGPESDYLALSLACTVSLVYLATNINTKLLVETQSKMEAVEADLRIAARIQLDALPEVAPSFADHLEMDLRASMNTAREVGGDFYDYFVIDDRRLCFLIADVSGKGTPAALFMMTVKTTIKDHAFMCKDTAEIFTVVNRRLCENNAAGMFATAWIGIYDKETGILQYTNAGHNYPLLLRDGEPCTVLKKKHGLFLAGMDDTEYRQSELELKAGDRLLLYTDGITEAHDISDAMYGTDRLIHVLESSGGKKGEDILEQIIADVNAFAQGAPQFDDMTMVILSIKE